MIAGYLRAGGFSHAPMALGRRLSLRYRRRSPAASLPAARGGAALLLAPRPLSCAALGCGLRAGARRPACFAPSGVLGGLHAAPMAARLCSRVAIALARPPAATLSLRGATPVLRAYRPSPCLRWLGLRDRWRCGRWLRSRPPFPRVGGSLALVPIGIGASKPPRPQIKLLMGAAAASPPLREVVII